MEIDYALAWDFYLPGDDRPYQLRFRRDGHFSDTGQLMAVVAKYRHPDNGHTIAISRAGVNFHDVEAALTGWQNSGQAHRVDRRPRRHPPTHPRKGLT